MFNFWRYPDFETYGIFPKKGGLCFQFFDQLPHEEEGITGKCKNHITKL